MSAAINNQNQGSDKEKPQQKPDHHPKAKNSTAFFKLVRTVLIDAALVVWIVADFFLVSGVERPKVAIWLLGLTQVLFFLHFVHKFNVSKIHKRYKKFVWPSFFALCVLIVIGCCIGTSEFDKKWRSDNEPKVIPSVVQLSDGKYEKLTRVLICNPSDSWIYQVVFLIEVENNLFSVENVKTTLTDGQSSDKFEQASKNHAMDALMGPWMLFDHSQFDYLQPPFGGRLLVL